MMKKDYIYKILETSSESLTAEEIYTKVSSKININVSTVYRTLNRFIEKGIVKKIIRQNKIAYYELILDEHKHYLICDNCNISLPTEFCVIDKISKTIKKDIGFNIEHHTLEIHGTCADCSKNVN